MTQHSWESARNESLAPKFFATHRLQSEASRPTVPLIWKNAFAMSPGGGADYALIPGFAVHLIAAEYLHALPPWRQQPAKQSHSCRRTRDARRQPIASPKPSARRCGSF
jgi:hypothetical protein